MTLRLSSPIGKLYLREPPGRSFFDTTSMRAAGEEHFYTTSASLPDVHFFILPPCAPQAKEKIYYLRGPPGVPFFTTSASLPVVPFFEYYFMDKPYAF